MVLEDCQFSKRNLVEALGISFGSVNDIVAKVLNFWNNVTKTYLNGSFSATAGAFQRG